jgi:hypothetical protein
VIVFVAVALLPALSTTRTATVQVAADGAVAVAVGLPAGDRTSNPGWPSKFHSIPVIGMFTLAGLDVDVNVTVVPATTGLGAQSKSAVSWATATPVPSGDATAPTVAKQAASRSLT